MHKADSSGPHEQGNVLFLILIAVALFAALSYAVTSSTRTNGGGVSTDKARANAAQIVQFATALRITVSRLKFMSNCTDTTLDFGNSVYVSTLGTGLNGSNNTAPLDKTCHLFSPQGGNLIPIVPVPDALIPNATTWPSGNGAIRIHQIKQIGTDDVAGTESANDIVFFQPYLAREVCTAINDILEVPNAGTEPPSIGSTGSAGTYANGSLTGTSLINNPIINGKVGFCRKAATNLYQYFHVIVDR